MKQQPTTLTTEKTDEEGKGQCSFVYAQQSKTKEEWKTITFHKGKKKLMIKETKESSAKVSINANIFDATTGKFLISQTLNYKVRQKIKPFGG